MGKKDSYLHEYRWTLDVTWEQLDETLYVIYCSNRIARWKGKTKNGSHAFKRII